MSNENQCCSPVTGNLGNYCPLLITQSHFSPLLTENNKCLACYTWRLATKQSHEAKIHFPEVNLDNAIANPIHVIDYLLNGKKILLVEDNIVSMKVLEKTLGELNQACIKAENGQVALDKISENSDIGLILLDLDMPVMNGFQLMENIFKMYDDSLPFSVVLVSELREWKEAKTLIEQGVHSQVKKPYTTEELLATIKYALFEQSSYK